MPARHNWKGSPVHAEEAKGIRWLVAGLPNGYVVYSNIEISTGQRGQSYEHDIIVVAPHGVFAVELKSWGGTITGNRDRWTLGKGDLVQSPLPLILAKARSLKGRLVGIRRDLADAWVQGLIFLSAGDAVPHITPDFAGMVLTQRDVITALTTPGAFGHARPLSPNQLGHIHAFLNDGKATRAPEQINGFRLETRLAAEDRPYQAWLARRGNDTRVLHIHTVLGDDVNERERSRNHAMREATLHEKLRGGPDVLGYRDFFEVTEDPPRVVLMFDDTTPLVSLDVWVRSRAPGLAARLKTAARAARAVAWVHGRGLVHRRLSPEAVLVTGATADAPSEVRLTGFDLARDLAAVSPTITGTSLGDPSFRCAAPEALKTGEATARSDLFSLGALVYELLAGRGLFATPDAVLRPFSLAPFDVVGKPVPDDVFRMLGQLLDADPVRRPESADAAADVFEAAHDRLTKAKPRVEWEPGREIRGSYELKSRLGRGATATTWLATHIHGGADLVLKIAEAVHAPLLRAEHQVGMKVQHPNLVRVLSLEAEGDHHFLGLSYVDGVTATLWAGAGDPLDPPRFLHVARGLLFALHALHEGGFLHRDVKPDNVMLRESDATVTLIDLGLAVVIDAEGSSLAAGTVQYKDPLLYTEGKWSRANDQYAAFLVLYELLTGAHPFGSAAPDSGHLPAIEADLFPDTFGTAAGKALAAIFTAALAPVRDARPQGIPEALDALEGALGTARTVTRPAVRTDDLPAVITPDHPVDALPLSVRAQGALGRLAMVTLRDLAALTPTLLERLPSVGAKTGRELLGWSSRVRSRWPDLPTDAPAALERYYPPLGNDERLLSDVELGLSKSQRAGFAERGVRTVGDLARMPVIALASLPSFPAERQAATRGHLVRLAGRDGGFDSLDALDGALRDELGERAHAALSAVIGLRDGQPRGMTEAGDAIGVSRQRVHQLLEPDELRKAGSVGRQLASIVEELLPAAGFSPLRAVAEALVLRLPIRAPGQVSPVGYARLAAILLDDSLRPTDAGDIEWLVRPPWSPAELQRIAASIETVCAWPPRPRRAVELAVWDTLDEAIQRALVRWGADAAALLDAVLPLATNVRVDAFGGVYAPPVSVVDALRQLRPVGTERASASALLTEAQERWDGVPDADDVEGALRAAGYVEDGATWVDPARVAVAVEAAEPKVDATVPRQRAGRHAGIVGGLANQVDRGGFRVVVMRPGEARTTSLQLAGWLGEEVGAERVRFVDVDRVVIDGLKAAGMWESVPYFEGNAKADWGWVRGKVRVHLEQLVRDCVPGRLTVLARPSLLGTLGLMDWLGGFYERARGGAHGLVVLAVPGGIHEDRVRLNERYNLACTPDMAAVFLEGP